MTRLALNETVYHEVIQKRLPAARRFVWIATADIKDMHVAYRARKFDSILAVFRDLVQSGVEIRLIHAKEPGPRFRADFDRFPELRDSERFERVLCPRNHMKCILIDGTFAYLGSANLTGAGLGAKSASRRNFEAGIITDDPEIVRPAMEVVDRLFIGDFCPGCGRRDICPDPIA